MKIKQGLKNLGYSELGKLQGPAFDVKKTLNVVYELLQQRQRDLEFRNDIIDKTAKLESDKKSLRQSVERLKLELEGIKRENGSMQNSQIIAEKKSKSEREKLLLEKEELSKQINKMTHRDLQLHVELRKKEAELNKLKDQLKKVIVEKSGNNKVMFIK
jgi:DNA repair exonuclease SbcCD ATPase subunit